MITFEPAAVHVLAARAEGRLTRDDIQTFVSELDDKLAHHETIGIVTDVTRLDGMTLAAVAEDFQAELKYLGEWERFPRMAMIAADGFLKTAAETFGALLPQIELRVFAPHEREEAFAFAAGAGNKAPGGRHEAGSAAG